MTSNDQRGFTYYLLVHADRKLTM